MESYIDFYTVRLKLSEFPVVDDRLSIYISVLFSFRGFNYEIVLHAKVSTTDVIFRELNGLSEDNLDLAEVTGGDSCLSERFPCCGGLDVNVPLPPDRALNCFYSVLELFFEVDELEFKFRILLRLFDCTLLFSDLSLWIVNSCLIVSSFPISSIRGVFGVACFKVNDQLKLFGLDSKVLIRNNAQCDRLVIKLFAVGVYSKQIRVELDRVPHHLSDQISSHAYYCEVIDYQTAIRCLFDLGQGYSEIP